MTIVIAIAVCQPILAQDQPNHRTVTYDGRRIVDLIQTSDRRLTVIDRSGEGDGPLIVTPHEPHGGAGGHLPCGRGRI